MTFSKEVYNNHRNKTIIIVITKITDWLVKLIGYIHVHTCQDCDKIHSQ